MNGTVAPPSSSSTAAATWLGRTSSSSAMRWLIDCNVFGCVAVTAPQHTREAGGPTGSGRSGLHTHGHPERGTVVYTDCPQIRSPDRVQQGTHLGGLRRVQLGEPVQRPPPAGPGLLVVAG